MVTTIATPSTPVPAQQSEADRGTRAAAALGPLLVATDGSHSADPAFMAANLLAERLGAKVDVVSVVELAPVFVAPPQILSIPTDFDGEAMERLRARAQQQVTDLVGDTAHWHVDVLVGEPASTVRKAARDRNASLVVTGIGRHGIIDRAFGEETAAHIAGVTETPMLAVTAPFTGLPRTVVIAIDLDSPSISNDRVLRELLSEASSVYFVNAKPPVAASEAYDLSSWNRMYADAIVEAYERVKRSLDLPARVSQQLVELTGSAAKEIIDFAHFSKAELIVVGQRRGSLLRRRFGTGLPARVLRSTACPVLVLPRTRRHTAASWMSEHATPATSRRTQTFTDRRQWPERLATVSRQNTGRIVALEIDDVDLGAQAQASGYPFAGAAYDHIDDRIEVMLGARKAGGAHLTHSVEAPTSIDLLERADGELMALRIANARGQILLTFPG